MIRTHLRRDLWTIHGAEESSGVNSSPARAAGQVVGKNLIRLNSSEFKNSTSGPLINRLKYVQIRFLFRRDIGIFKKLRGVHHKFCIKVL